ncbi:hypothetical protein TWF225_007659 [Orbilia oligospora]|uniref:Uncharacterized protein n=1 Tax=Orbilia oligospora TaxID=2813651 RepID=A0A8H2DRG0_ORBOL|nr:hypothetical protein TWF225_007659 [Orbilia oligospora]KAF3240430.1 hypothetical protein TWF128_011267 [Orbilia oligospora]TGJ64279.1 hypothetical protein EYR41_010342 [Orbilia oligospora]
MENATLRQEESKGKRILKNYRIYYYHNYTQLPYPQFFAIIDNQTGKVFKSQPAPEQAAAPAPQFALTSPL